MGAAIVAGVDAPPVLELAEHVLDFVALSIEGLSYGMGIVRLALEGIHGVMPRAVKAVQNQSAS
jgi:hypothetical protein